MSCELTEIDDPESKNSPNETTFTEYAYIDGKPLIRETFAVTRNIGKRKIADWAYPGYAEHELTEAISFCPTDDQVKAIIGKGTTATANNIVTTKIDQTVRSPTESVWFNILSKKTNEQKNVYKDGSFVMVFDRSAPMTDTSMGMNGLLTKFEGEDEKRFNLFMRDEGAVFDLMNRFMEFRCKHQDTIIAQTIKDMNEKNEASPLLSLALEVKGERDVTFAALGLGLVSFCQTWDLETGKPNFSQPSPHFQTKVIVRDPAKLFMELKSYKGDNDESVRDVCGMFKEYAERVLALKEAMLNADYSKKFVNIDALYARMAATRTPSPFVMGFTRAIMRAM